MKSIPTKYDALVDDLKTNPKTWLITGVAGFIGSNILEHLLKMDQKVVGLDSYINGGKKNLKEIKKIVTNDQWSKFSFIEGDICNFDVCKEICKGIDYVLHQAALGSVPRSIVDPIVFNDINISGFLNILLSSKNAEVRSFTFASSSSTYGNSKILPKVEDNVGKPLSPYALSKNVNEMYAEMFDRVYDFKSIGLRYFNVFGKRQDPNGAYAAVIPKWIAAMLKDEEVFINGDGETSRDFCFIENVVQANLLAATAKKKAKSEVYNVGFGERTTLNQLFKSLKSSLKTKGKVYDRNPIYLDFREGDVRHSHADISKISNMLGYSPKYGFDRGIEKVVQWYLDNLN